MNEPVDIYDFGDYKTYLHTKVGPRTTRKGIRGALARTLRCQPTYVSQVLYGRAHFSLEQAELVSDFFGHTSDERHYLILLLQKDRAGTKRLEQYFLNQIEKVKASRLVLTQRLGAQNNLGPEEQSIYYSSWHYAAIHMALTVPTLQTAAQLREHFRISQGRLIQVLEFLTETGLAKKVGESFEAGEVQIRLGNLSHNIIKHHTNWRNQAIDALDREKLTDLHYSGVFSLSQQDVVKIKDRTLEFIKATVSSVRASREEVVYGFCIDFFDLKK